MRLTRRQALQGAGALAATAWLSGCSRGDETTSVAAPSSDSARKGTGEPFVEPVVLRSSAGRLDLSLDAAAATHPGAASGALAYNNSAIGPTLRLRPGDRLTIELTNNLDDATNLHTHGLTVSPTSPADDVFVSVAPGETRTYVYDLPKDHRSGLFWYHPHLHGVVATQVAAGLVGAIIVDDALDDMEEISTSRERLWVLNDPTAADRAVSGMDQMHGRTGSSVMVNGASKPTFEVEAGVVERWRIVNASASRRLPFAVDGASLALIASDGGRLAVPIDVQGVVLSPGERAEVLVVPPTETGSYQVTGDGSGGEIATLVVAEANAAAPTLPARLVDPSLFEIGAVTARRTLRFGSEMGGGMMSDGGLSFTIDGRTFDPERVDIDTVLGEIEEWTIVNDTGMDHPFHLHVWPFQVVDDTGWPGWKDTVNVPGGAQVTIRIPFVGHTGRTVYHCHILDHEDIGMMGVINVSATST